MIRGLIWGGVFGLALTAFIGEIIGLIGSFPRYLVFWPLIVADHFQILLLFGPYFFFVLMVVGYACMGAAIGGFGQLLRRKERMPNLCPNCGYDLTGNVSGVCPECGTEVDAK